MTHIEELRADDMPIAYMLCLPGYLVYLSINVMDPKTALPHLSKQQVNFKQQKYIACSLPSQLV